MKSVYTVIAYTRGARKKEYEVEARSVDDALNLVQIRVIQDNQECAEREFVVSISCMGVKREIWK